MYSLSKSWLLCCFVGCFFVIGCSLFGGDKPCEQDSECPNPKVCVSGQCIQKSGSQTEKTVSDGDVDAGPKEPCQSKGATRSCYTGPSGTQGKGFCSPGEQVCEKGHWSSCEGQVLPKKELCDGVDNNCDGRIDEVCRTCTPGETKPCYEGPVGTKGVGICKEGVQTCLKIAEWGKCLQQIHPTIELCNSKDDNCNGQVDENCKQCIPGAQEACYPNSPGCVKENTLYRCKGKCKAGHRICQPNGTWSVCTEYRTPTKEYCNNTDDDCNGVVDDNMNVPLCSKQVGVCAGSKQRCANGRWYDCTHTTYQQQNGAYNQQDNTCDGKDNNCDGRVDEGCASCNPGQSRSCYGGDASSKGKGPCKAGTQTCQGDKTWGVCNNQVVPTTELCNGIDDNCNGYVDESFKEQGVFCTTTKPGRCSQGLYQCSSGKLTCKQLFQPVIEICNKKDDDCNGKIDDSASLYTYYKDSDNDGYGTASQTTQACGAPAGFVNRAGDCFDTSKLVLPTQYSYFTKDRGDGSFDYNCDGKQEQRFVENGSCGGCQSVVIKNGWSGAIPACGKTGKWIDKCRSDVGKCYPVLIDKVQECR